MKQQRKESLTSSVRHLMNLGVAVSDALRERLRHAGATAPAPSCSFWGNCASSSARHSARPIPADWLAESASGREQAAAGVLWERFAEVGSVSLTPVECVQGSSAPHRRRRWVAGATVQWAVHRGHKMAHSPPAPAPVPISAPSAQRSGARTTKQNKRKAAMSCDDPAHSVTIHPRAADEVHVNTPVQYPHWLAFRISPFARLVISFYPSTVFDSPLQPPSSQNACSECGESNLREGDGGGYSNIGGEGCRDLLIGPLSVDDGGDEDNLAAQLRTNNVGDRFNILSLQQFACRVATSTQRQKRAPTHMNAEGVLLIPGSPRVLATYYAPRFPSALAAQFELPRCASPSWSASTLEMRFLSLWHRVSGMGSPGPLAINAKNDCGDSWYLIRYVDGAPSCTMFVDERIDSASPLLEGEVVEASVVRHSHFKWWFLAPAHLIVQSVTDFPILRLPQTISNASTCGLRFRGSVVPCTIADDALQFAAILRRSVGQAAAGLCDIITIDGVEE